MDLFTKHYPVEGKFEDSAYYYWYLYMQLVDGYGPGHLLWEEFGDVQMPFWDWWCAHGEDLFVIGRKYGVWELETDAEIQRARNDGAFIVSIDTDCTRDYLMSLFRGFLDEKGCSKTAGRRKHSKEVYMAKRAFCQRPDVTSLRISLDVLKLRQKNPKPTLYTIGKELGLCPEHVIDVNDTPKEVSDKKNVMNATVSRYLRWAKEIKSNVAKGVFPMHQHSSRI